MAKTPTAYLALMLPVPGSKEPFRVSDVNGWFTTLDSKIQAMDGVSTGINTRLDVVERYTDPGEAAATAQWGIVPRMTTAQRDAMFPSAPLAAGAAARVALADRGVRIFNIDKGWEEQYYAKFDDAGVVATTPVKPAFGWGPAAHIGRVLLTKNFTVTQTGTGSTSAKKGGLVEFSNANLLSLMGIFTDDFDTYEIEMDLAGTPDGGLYLDFRFGAGAGIDASASYVYVCHYLPATGTFATQISNAGAVALRGGLANGNTSMRARIGMVRSATNRTHVMGQSYSAANDNGTFAGGHTQTAKQDNLSIVSSGGSASRFTGTLRVYGITN